MYKKYSCVMQHDASDCAAATIATVLEYYKAEISFMKLREILGTDLYGTTVKGIVDGLNKLDFDAKAIRIDVNSLDSKITLPAVANIITEEGMSHFVVIHQITNKGKFIIADPAKGIRKLNKEAFSGYFTGVIIFMIPKLSHKKLNKEI